MTSDEQLRDSALQPGSESAPASDSDGGVRLQPADVARIYGEHSGELLTFLIGVLRNADDAREALQCTFRRCLEVGHTAREETRRGWLFRVAFHEAMGLRRKSGAQQRKLSNYSREWMNSQTADIDNLHTNPEWQLVSREQAELLREALQELPSEQRWVVERRIHHDETFATIAEQLQVPIGTVLTRMRLAITKLKRRLKDPEQPDPD